MRPHGATFAAALALVPLVGVAELALHVHQTSDVVPESDWVAAKEAIAKDLSPDDLVTFAPTWTDPLGREAFGDEIMTRKRAARSDVSRFRRAWEVSIRGARDEALAGWQRGPSRRYGGVTVTLLTNPAPDEVVSDLVDFVDPRRMSVSLIDDSGAGVACSFTRGASAGGSTVVPQGLLVPGDKFVCGGAHVGVAVLHALDHRPHLCIKAAPAQGSTLRLTFRGVTFGDALVGHSGVQWINERVPSQDRTTIDFRAFDLPLGTNVHKLGAGWKEFELPTAEIAGKTGDLVAELGGSAQRFFCFEATTRKRRRAP